MAAVFGARQSSIMAHTPERTTMKNEMTISTVASKIASKIALIVRSCSHNIRVRIEVKVHTPIKPAPGTPVRTADWRSYRRKMQVCARESKEAEEYWSDR